jgi:hypothetical protein
MSEFRGGYCAVDVKHLQSFIKNKNGVEHSADRVPSYHKMKLCVGCSDNWCTIFFKWHLNMLKFNIV